MRAVLLPQPRETEKQKRTLSGYLPRGSSTLGPEKHNTQLPHQI